MVELADPLWAPQRMPGALSVLHIITRFRRGGSERNLLHALHVEAEAGYDIHVALGADSEAYALPRGVRVHHIASLVRGYDIQSDAAALRSLRHLVANRGFDVVHTHQSKAGVLGRVAARGRAGAVVHTVHMASFGPGYGRIASRTFLAAERYCARFTDQIVCVGNELVGLYLAAGVGVPGQYVTIRSPLDVDAFAAARCVKLDARLAARNYFGLRGSRAFLVTCVGALEPRKRVDLILRRLAAILVPGRLELAVAGAGPESRALAAAAHELGIGRAVHLLGHVEDVPLLLSAADVLVHASRAEGVPQVVLQALAAGLPVVATDVEGLREVPGAPVTVVNAGGAGLAEAVAALSVQPRPQPIDLMALDPWRKERVSEQIFSLYGRISEALPRARSHSWR